MYITATRKWPITVGFIEGGNSYKAPSKEILVSKRIEINYKRIGIGVRICYFL